MTELDTHLIDLTDPASRMDLYCSCLELRRAVFIDSLNWNLYQRNGCEYDGYDNPGSVHIAATLPGEDQALGCIRLLRTDSDHNGLTYMILDAHRDAISNLPSDIMEREIISPEAWEASRLAISSSVPRESRNSVLLQLVSAAKDFVIANGGNAMLGLMNPVFQRVFRRAKYDVKFFGPERGQRDGPVRVLYWDFSESLSGAGEAPTTACA